MSCKKSLERGCAFSLHKVLSDMVDNIDSGCCRDNKNYKGKAMSDNHGLQDEFLNELCKEKIPVSVFLISGIKLHGVVDNFDQNVIMLKNAVTQMVYKNAISTVVPARLVSLPTGE